MAEIELDLGRAICTFYVRNYNYLWLKTMLGKARGMTVPGSTLITGSSHALNGIQESAWNSAVNCSMHSQDIYYDFLCAKTALDTPERGQIFTRCFIVMGYYIAYQDLSLSKASRESMISQVYYPIFHDAHNWSDPANVDLWAPICSMPKVLEEKCEEILREKILKCGTYYHAEAPRGCYFDLKGRKWADTSDEEKDAMGKYRARDHNRVLEYTDSFRENQEIFKDFVHFLCLKNVQPIVVVTPFTSAYNRYVSRELKKAMAALLDAVPEDVHYVDFNQAPELFEDRDFMDTDHLSAQGAQKVSSILADMFGR